MASKQVQDLLVRLKIDGLEGLDSLKGAFRELAKTIGPTEQVIEKARQSIIEFGEAGNKSEQLIKGQIEALKGLRSQATQGGKVYKELTANIKDLRGAAYGASPAVESQRKALTALGLSADATASQIEQAINSLINLRGEVRVDSQAFDNFGKSIAELTDRFRAVNQEAQNFAQAQQRIARPIGATSAAARQQIRDLDLVTESLREQRDALGALEGEARIKAGAAGLAERGAPAAGRRTFEEAVSEAAFGGDIKKLLPSKDIKAALDEVAREIASFQQEIEIKLSRKIQISFQEAARAGRESARAMAAAFSDPELINVFNQFDKRLGELPDTTTGLNQRLSELSERLANTKRNTVDYLVVAMQMAGVQRELTAVTQGYAQSLLMGIRTGTVAPSARNLQEVIAALRAEMSQLDVTTSEGARAYAENAREARALEQRLNGLANAYRHVGDMAAQAATAEASAATARITANYLNRGIVRQQEAAMAELGQRVRAGVAATPLALPAAGQTTAPGTGLEISGGARVGRATGRIQRFFTRFDVGDAQLQMPGAPQAQGPQATEQQAERARRAAISEAEAVRTAAEARQQAERQIQSYRAEIDKARRADIGSIDSTQRLREAINQYRSTLPGASAEFKKLTKELGELDARSEKLGRGLARRRMTGMQMAQAAGAALSGGIFGGPEGFLGGAIGTAVGGVGGAFAGAAIGAQIGGLRKQLGGFADYAAQIQKMEIALKNAAGGQAEFNQAVAAAASATQNLNVPQDVAIQGMTKLTAAVKGAGGQVTDAELVFRNVTSAIKATGGSAQDVDGAITAMVQVFSKGKVSAEELSGQLGERLPGAVTKFAEANEMTLPELQKALEQGQVGLNELMNFIVQLGDEYSGVAQQIAGSSQDAGARLTIAYNQMRVSIGEALQPVGAQFQEAFIPFIEQITPALVAVLPEIGKFMVTLAKNFDTAAIAVSAFIATLAVAKITSFTFNLGGLIAGLGSVATAAGGAATAMTGLAAASAAVPWVALAAGAAAAGAAIYNAATAQQEFNKKIYEAPLVDVKAEIQQLTKNLLEAEEKLVNTAMQFGTLSREAAFAQAKVDGLRAALDQAKGDYKVRLLFEQVGVTPSDKYFGPGFAAQQPQPKPSKFPALTPDKTSQAKSAADKAARDEQRIQERIRNLGIETQSIIQQALFKGRIAEAEIAGNKELAIRLRGEARAQQISQELEKSLIGITDERVKQALLVKSQAEIESAGIDTAIELERQRLAVIKEQNDELFKRAGFTPQDAMRDGAGAFDPSLPDLRVSPAESQMTKYREELEALSNPINMAVTGANAIGDAFGQAFQGIVTGSQSTQEALSNAFKAIGEAFVQMAVEIIAKQLAMIAFQTILKALGGGGSFGFSGAGPAQLPSGPGFAQGFSMPSLLANAKGNAFAQNGIQPFANGGIVTKPTFFKYADGGTFSNGVMGEAGPEAIMPLKRGADGKLGVTIADTRAALAEQSAARSTNDTRNALTEQSIARQTNDTRAMLEQQTAARQANATGMALQQKPIDVRYESTIINQTEYVSAEQHRKGMAEAAERGRALTLAALQNSTRTRKKVGI